MVRTGLDLYTSVAAKHSTLVLRDYSTSFGVASRLLPKTKRQHIAQIYALVRIADEIVDGPAADSGLSLDEQATMLDTLEQDTCTAVLTGFSSNLVVHSFAQTARAVGIGDDLIVPFFASMRADLTRAEHDEESIRDYIYGSAEVIGLMCVAVFIRGGDVKTQFRGSDADMLQITKGAQHLGAAFQKINFLRDLAADSDDLGRNYFPGVDVQNLSEENKNLILDNIDHDVAIARASVPLLPRDSQNAVALATELFAGLAAKLRQTPAETIINDRIRLGLPTKLSIAARTVFDSPRRRSRRGVIVDQATSE